jgi:hypothetical protein
MDTGTSFSSATIAEHLARGVIAIGALIAATNLLLVSAWWTAPASLGLGVVGLVMLRGCPMCWTIGLIETIRSRRKSQRLSSVYQITNREV